MTASKTILNIPTTQTSLDPTSVLYAVTTGGPTTDTQLPVTNLLNYPVRAPTTTTPVDVYNQGDQFGQSYTAIKATDSSTHTGHENYGFQVQFQTTGGGDPTVPGSNYGIGISAIKQNWTSTTIDGQVCGINIVNRSGYFGSTPPQPTYTAGDSSGILVNTVQAGSASYTSILEGFAAYYYQGNVNAADKQSIRVQLAPLRKDLNLAIGCVVIGSEGALGSAYQAQNVTGSTWTSLLQYQAPTLGTSFDMPITSGVPRIRLFDGVGGSKSIRVNSNKLSILNATEATEIATIDNSGNIQAGNFTGGIINSTGNSSFTGNVGITGTLVASGNEAFSYTNTSGQSITTATQTTVTNWTKTYDRLNVNFNTTTGTWTVPVTGIYSIKGQLTFSSAAGVVGANYQISILVNGSVVNTNIKVQETTTAASVTVPISVDLSLTAGNTVTVQVQQTTGVSRTLSAGATFNWLTVSRIP